MTRTLLIVLTASAAAPVQAHVGHIGEVAGHGHWIAGIAIGAAAGLAVWGLLKGKKDPEAEAEELEEESGEEEPA